MTLPKLTDRPLVSDQVFGAIHQAIMSGAIPAGSRLPIRNLADQLGTSPMPVRDALARLEQVGLAKRVPHKGTVVARLTPTELVAVYDTRLVLEREGTRLGSQQLSRADADRMRAEHRLMLEAVRAGRRVEALDRDEALLTILYAASGNDVLVELVQALWRRCRAYKLFGVQGALSDADPSVWTFQERLIEAAAAHDTATAVKVTEESLVSATTRIRSMLA